MASTTIKDAAPNATAAQAQSVSSDTLPVGVAALGDVAVRTQGGGGIGSDDKCPLYQ